VLAKGVVYNLHRSFFVVVCVVGFEGRASVVGLGIIATEHEVILTGDQQLATEWNQKRPLPFPISAVLV
jgi:hypothetical protein